MRRTWRQARRSTGTKSRARLHTLEGLNRRTVVCDGPLRKRSGREARAAGGASGKGPTAPMGSRSARSRVRYGKGSSSRSFGDGRWRGESARCRQMWSAGESCGSHGRPMSIDVGLCRMRLEGQTVEAEVARDGSRSIPGRRVRWRVEPGVSSRVRIPSPAEHTASAKSPSSGYGNLRRGASWRCCMRIARPGSRERPLPGAK